MAKHTKPTKEELEQKLQEAEQELENNPEVNPDADPQPEPEPEIAPDELEVEPESEPEPDEQEPEPQPDIDYRKKYVESTREAQVLHAKNKKINEVIETAMQMADPTDEDLAKEYGDWDLMSDMEKKLARETMVSNRRFAMLEEVTRESKEVEKWNGKVDEFVSSPETLVKHPELEGRGDDFKLFASKPTRRGVDFDDLISAFMYERSKTVKKNKGAMFETGSPGPNDRQKLRSNKLTIEQAAILKKTNYKEFVRLLKEGKIESEPKQE